MPCIEFGRIGSVNPRSDQFIPLTACGDGDINALVADAAEKSKHLIEMTSQFIWHVAVKGHFVMGAYLLEGEGMMKPLDSDGDDIVDGVSVMVAAQTKNIDDRIVTTYNYGIKVALSESQVADPELRTAFERTVSSAYHSAKYPPNPTDIGVVGKLVHPAQRVGQEDASLPLMAFGDKDDGSLAADAATKIRHLVAMTSGVLRGFGDTAYSSAEGARSYVSANGRSIDIRYSVRPDDERAVDSVEFMMHGGWSSVSVPRFIIGIDANAYDGPAVAPSAATVLRDSLEFASNSRPSDH